MKILSIPLQLTTSNLRIFFPSVNKLACMGPPWSREDGGMNHSLGHPLWYNSLEFNTTLRKTTEAANKWIKLHSAVCQLQRTRGGTVWPAQVAETAQDSHVPFWFVLARHVDCFLSVRCLLCLSSSQGIQGEVINTPSKWDPCLCCSISSISKFLLAKLTPHLCPLTSHLLLFWLQNEADRRDNGQMLQYPNIYCWIF